MARGPFRAMFRPFIREWSLGSKLLLGIGGAVALTVVGVLALPFLRLEALVRAGEVDAARALVDAWESVPADQGGPRPGAFAGAAIRRVPAETAAEDERLGRAARELAAERGREVVVDERWEGLAKRYTFYFPVRGVDGSLAGVTEVVRTSEAAGQKLALNALYVVAAGALVLAAALIAVLVISSRLVLAPVEELRAVAQAVRGGEIKARGAVKTGDELEELGEAFNLMLDGLAERESKLRAVNEAMDVKLTELAEVNEALDRAARIKGEFVAKVSHELRTPLNSIMGFAEILLELARQDARASAESNGSGAPDAGAIAKRQRYLENIAWAGRTLLELIEGLLEMARLEAGRSELRLERLDAAEACRGMAGVIEPLAARKGAEVTLEVRGEVGSIRTDRRKFQQIIFNLLSNAVKFLPDAAADPSRQQGRVVVRVERLAPGPGEEKGAVRVSVIDNGPGIDPADQGRIFEKFEQLEATATRAQGGAGLGLAICRELTAVLDGQLQLESQPGAGSMFSLVLPHEPRAERVEEAKLEAKFRGSLTVGRWRED